MHRGNQEKTPDGKIPRDMNTNPEEDMDQTTYQSSVQNGLLYFEELPNHGKFLRPRERELIERCKQMFLHIAGFFPMHNTSIVCDASLLQDLLDRDEKGRAPSDPQYLDYKAANETIANLQEQVKKLKEEAKASGQCEQEVASAKGFWSANFVQLARGIDMLQKTLNDKEQSDDTAS